MSFWRKEVIDSALHHETAAHLREQKEWIAREPANPRPWYNLAQLYRIEHRQDEALALLLEAVRLADAGAHADEDANADACADAHVALAEIYAVRADYEAARRHARKAADRGNLKGLDLLRRHAIE